MRVPAPIVSLFAALTAAPALAVTPVASKTASVEATSASTTQVVSAQAFERLPTARGVRELLLLVPGIASERPVDRVEVELGPGNASGAQPTYLPPGWSWKASGNGIQLSGPPAPGGIKAAFGLPKSERPVGSIDLALYEKKQKLSELRVPTLQLNPPIRLTDPKGAIRLPQLLSPGDRIRFRPLDPKFTPGGGDWKIGGWTPKWNGSYDKPLYEFDLPRDLGKGVTLPLRISYVSPWNETLVDGLADDVAVGRAPKPAGDRPAVTGCSPAVLDNGSLCLCGNFPSEALAELRINGQPIDQYLVSSSPSIVNLTLPGSFAAGPYDLSAGASSGFDIADGARGVLIHVGGEIDRDKLKRGESTTLKLWLDGTDKPVDLELRNSTPGIVSLAGGDDQVVTTSGGAPNQVTRTVSAVSPGDFALHYQLTVDACPCAKEGGPAPEAGE